MLSWIIDVACRLQGKIISKRLHKKICVAKNFIFPSIKMPICRADCEN